MRNASVAPHGDIARASRGVAPHGDIARASRGVAWSNIAATKLFDTLVGVILVIKTVFKLLVELNRKLPIKLSHSPFTPSLLIFLVNM